MKITPIQMTIAQLLSSKNDQFFIPAYQRRYAWGNKQLVELFGDIKLLDKNDSHFLGTILILTESHKASINTLEVVDGQQRIISLSLLLEAIRDKFVELKQNDIVQEIETMMFCQGIDRMKRNKIILGDLDEPDYSKVLALKNEADETNAEQIKSQKLLHAYREFKKVINAFKFEELNEFYFKLINNTIVVRLDTEKAKDAYKLFETVNNRGLRLSPTDIIKNFLLGHASMVSEDVLNEVRESWKSVIVSLDDIETDEFFRHHLMGILKRKITFTKLTSEFKKHYITTVKEAEILPEYKLYHEYAEYDSGDDNSHGEEEENIKIVEDEEKSAKNIKKVSIVDFAKELRINADIYSKLVNRAFKDRNINQHIFNLQRIKSLPAYTFLLSLFRYNQVPNENVEILKVIESFMLRRHICEWRTSELDDIFSKVTSFDKKNILADIKAKLCEDLPEDDEFEAKFAAHSFKGNHERAKYVLEQFEYHLIENQGEYVINSGKEVHLDHIIPQTINTKRAIRELGDWVSYLGNNAVSQHHRYLDRIGNYALLAQKLNIRASNNPYGAKKKEYRKSNIRLTQDIAANHSRFKFKQVDERSKELAKLAVKIWKLS